MKRHSEIMVDHRKSNLFFIPNPQTPHGSTDNGTLGGFSVGHQASGNLTRIAPKTSLNTKNHFIWLMMHLVLLTIMLLLKTSHNGGWMPASHPAREGNNNTRAGEKNTGKGCRGQVRSASIEARANWDNSVVTMLICTQPTATSVKNHVSHPAPKGTICPLLMHPLHPSRPFPSFQIHLRGDFPMPPELSSSPLSPLRRDLGDTPSLPNLFWC